MGELRIIITRCFKNRETGFHMHTFCWVWADGIGIFIYGWQGRIVAMNVVINTASTHLNAVSVISCVYRKLNIIFIANFCRCNHSKGNNYSLDHLVRRKQGYPLYVATYRMYIHVIKNISASWLTSESNVFVQELITIIIHTQMKNTITHSVCERESLYVWMNK